MSDADQAATWMDWMQLAAPFLAAVLASGFGFITYRDQRRVDRREAMIAEKRERYGSYLRAVMAWTSSIESGTDGKVSTSKQAENTALAEFALLGLYAPEAVVEQAEKLLQKLWDLHRAAKPVEDGNSVTIKSLGDAMRGTSGRK